jgi:hypothetical protein
MAQRHVVHSPSGWRIRRPYGGSARPLCRNTQPIGEFASRSRPSRVRSSATTASIGATERPTCSSSSTCIGPGAKSKSPTAAPPLTSRELTDVHFPKSERIRVVLDNLSTRSVGALYQAFPAAEARRVLRRLEFHYALKHASWLNWSKSRAECTTADAWKGASPQRSTSPPTLRLATTAQRLRRSHQMDVHNRESPRRNEPRLSRAVIAPKSHRKES